MWFKEKIQKKSIKKKRPHPASDPAFPSPLAKAALPPLLFLGGLNLN
jgi:hypothetical protein